MNKDIYDKYLNSINMTLTECQYNQYESFYELLVEWNSFMNLTGITEYEEVILKHFIDSIIIKNVYDMSGVKRVIDVGTGAGFPGLPLKIAYPDKHFTLLDSLNKRINFINAVVEKNDIKEIETLHGRAEDFAQKPEYREKYDLCVSRAVANLASLSEYCLPYVAVGGAFVAYKSGTIDEELENSKKAIKLLGGTIEDVKYLTLPHSDIERAFVIIRKTGNTPKKFPRKAGLPTKEPLS